MFRLHNGVIQHESGTRIDRPAFLVDTRTWALHKIGDYSVVENTLSEWQSKDKAGLITRDLTIYEFNLFEWDLGLLVREMNKLLTSSGYVEVFWSRFCVTCNLGFVRYPRIVGEGYRLKLTGTCITTGDIVGSMTFTTARLSEESTDTLLIFSEPVLNHVDTGLLECNKVESPQLKSRVDYTLQLWYLPGTAPYLQAVEAGFSACDYVNGERVEDVYSHITMPHVVLDCAMLNGVSVSMGDGVVALPSAITITL